MKPSKSVSSNRDRTLLLISFGLFAVAGGVFLGIAWLQRPQSHTADIVRSHWGHEASAEELAGSLSRAKTLRTLMLPWASRHSLSLSAMLHAKPEDESAMLQVLNQLPDRPNKEEKGVGAADLGLERSGFSWDIDSHAAPLSKQDQADPLVMQHIERGLSFRDKLRRHNFAAYHDLELGLSGNEGPKRYTLWVSGRITETTYSLEPKKDMYVEAIEREVAPAYDFLK